MDRLSKITKKTLIGIIRFYQTMLSPLLAPSCRHMPTCSEYASEAIRKLGVIKGVALTFKRIVNCRPGGTSGYDPVPEDKNE
tara:strand:- start:482 stop:727 length:246 start_codon:yes stop_codon:yes gene_type:complete